MAKPSPSKPDEKKLYQRALRWLNRREHSAFELRQKLVRLGGEAQAVKSVLEKLEQQQYLDDRRFAESYLRSRLPRGLGRVRLKQELAQRGIKADLAELALNAIELPDESQVALQLAQRRAELGKSEDSTMRFLFRRGFSSKLCRTATRQAYG